MEEKSNTGLNFIEQVVLPFLPLSEIWKYLTLNRRLVRMKTPLHRLDTLIRYEDAKELKTAEDRKNLKKYIHLIDGYLILGRGVYYSRQRVFLSEVTFNGTITDMRVNKRYKTPTDKQAYGLTFWTSWLRDYGAVMASAFSDGCTFGFDAIELLRAAHFSVCLSVSRQHISRLHGLAASDVERHTSAYYMLFFSRHGDVLYLNEIRWFGSCLTGAPILKARRGRFPYLARDNDRSGCAVTLIDAPNVSPFSEEAYPYIAMLLPDWQTAVDKNDIHSGLYRNVMSCASLLQALGFRMMLRNDKMFMDSDLRQVPNFTIFDRVQVARLEGASFAQTVTSIFNRFATRTRSSVVKALTLTYR